CVIGRCGESFSISEAIELASYGPTQMGKMPSPSNSFNRTIGEFVVGSTKRPRILTSSSIIPLPTRTTRVRVRPFHHFNRLLTRAAPLNTIFKHNPLPSPHTGYGSSLRLYSR